MVESDTQRASVSSTDQSEPVAERAIPLVDRAVGEQE
jgi:hypothetical protein